MTVGIKIGGVTSEIGTGDFFHALFSTIHHHLENGVWGEQYPLIMNGLYGGRIDQADAQNALVELDEIARGLANLAPHNVVWDIDNLEASAPWGNDISSDITDLSNYFVTSTGRDLIDTIRENLESSVSDGGDLHVVTY